MILMHFLDRSRATPAFRDAVTQFLRTARPSTTVVFGSRCPPVKVERTLTKILEEYPDLPIERVVIEGMSGCEFFRGVATLYAESEERRISFDWDCRWKANQMGWADYFGLPDQIRAARECGHDCFRTWSEETAAYSS